MPPDDSARTQSKRVLVVDDNPDSAELLRSLLERAGHRLLVVSSGRDALTVASDFAPHIALIDIGLPDMDGYKLTSRLREQAALSGCRFIAVTGHKSQSAVARSIAAGFEAHMSKPVNSAELLASVASTGLNVR